MSHLSLKLLQIQSVALEKWKVQQINWLFDLRNTKLVGFLIFPYKLVDISLKHSFNPIKGRITSALLLSLMSKQTLFVFWSTDLKMMCLDHSMWLQTEQQCFK